MARGNILVSGEAFSAEVAEELRAEGFEVRQHTDFAPEAELIELLRGKDAYVMAGDESITPKVAASLSGLKVIAFFGVGPETFFLGDALAQVTEKGIPVTITPGANNQAVAEMTLALIFDLLRKTTHLNNSVKRGEWHQFTAGELKDKTLGIVGLGRIGSTVAEALVKGFGARCVYFGRERKEELERELGLRFLSLEELLETSDIVTLHAILSDETRHMLSEQELGRLRPGSLLVNTARAELVEPTALRGALGSGRLGAAAFDGYYVEPADPVTDPHGLLALPDDVFLVTPHQAFNTQEANVKASRMVADAVRSELGGEAYRFRANL